MSRTILVVDDSQTMLQTISIILEREGYTIITAMNGLEALDILNGDTRFNLIFTDMNMPKMDGITLTREIKKLDRHRFVPIIFITTEHNIGKKEEAKEAGATGWITKPFSPAQLIDVVKKLSP